MEDQEIVNVIAQVTDKLGIAVSEIARIFIEAQPKIAIINIVLLLFTLLIPIVVFVVSWKHFFNKEKIKYATISRTDESVIGPATTYALITLITCIIMVLTLSDSFYRLIVPEYMGLKDMIYTFATIT